MDMIMVNAILVLFPILIYLVLSCYRCFLNKMVNRIIFVFTLITSLYLCFSCNSYFSLLLIFCSIPILISYFKRDGALGIVLSLITLIWCFRYDVNGYLFGLKLGCYLGVYLFLSKRREFNYLFLKISAIIEGFFISFQYFYFTNYGIEKVVNVMFYAGIIYGITFFSLYLFKLADRITDLYLSVNKMERESKLRDSLFKLTHEIKNPLAVCKGYMEMIDINDQDKALKYIEIVTSEINRSLNIMNDFMEYRKIKINKDLFDINLLIDEVYSSFDVLAERMHIKLIYKGIDDEIFVNGDYERLKQVFINLLKNSMESISDKGEIILGVKKMVGKVEVMVKDDGVGMDSEELKNIDKMFYTTKKNGTGLGVALSKEIILAHEGTIEYKSVKNEGTTCIVCLPV